jgi:hypothetical protein
MNFSKELISRGEIPLWNPYTNCGMPFLANMQSGVFYPLNAVFYIFDFVKAYKIYIFLHFFLAYLFMYFLLREFDFKPLICAAGATIWTFSGTMITRVEFLSMMGSTIYLPLCLMMLHRMIHSYKPNLKARYVIITALVIAVQFFAGHPQEFIYSMFFLSCYLIYHVICYRKPRLLLDFFIIAGITILISAVQFFPSLEFMLNSRRAGVADKSGIGLKYDEATHLSLSPKELRNLVYPFFYKEQVTNKIREKKIFRIPHLWIYAHHIGVFGIVFSIVGLFLCKKRIKLFFIAVMFLCICFAMGKYFFLYKLLYKFFLPLRFISHPATIMYLVVFSLCFCGCYGLSLIKRKSVLVVINVLIFLELYLYGHRINPVLPGNIFKETGTNIQYLTEHKDLHRFAHTPLTRMEIKTGGGNLFQSFAGYRDKLFGNVNMVYHLYNFYGQDTNLKIFYKYLNRVYSKRSPEAAGKLFSLANVKYILSCSKIDSGNYELVNKENFFTYRNRNPLPRVFMVPRARYVPREDTLEFIESDEFNPRKEAIVNDESIAGSEKTKSYDILMKQNLKVTLYEPRRIVIQTEKNAGSWLVLLDTYYPGWKAYVDNKETKIYRCNFLFRAVRVPEGGHTIKFVYFPGSFKFGAIVSFAALIFLLMYVVNSLRFQK